MDRKHTKKYKYINLKEQLPSFTWTSNLPTSLGQDRTASPLATLRNMQDHSLLVHLYTGSKLSLVKHEHNILMEDNKVRFSRQVEFYLCTPKAPCKTWWTPISRSCCFDSYHFTDFDASMLTFCSPTNSNKVYANKSLFEVLMVNNSVFNPLSSHGLLRYVWSKVKISY